MVAAIVVVVVALAVRRNVGAVSAGVLKVVPAARCAC